MHYSSSSTKEITYAQQHKHIHTIWVDTSAVGWTEPRTTDWSFHWTRWAGLANKQTNSVAWVHERTIPTEQPPLVGEVSANFCRYRVARGQRGGSKRPYSRFSRPKPLLFLPSSSSVVLTRLSGTHSRTTTCQKNLVVPGIEPGPLDL
jgi:hypothetical protein